MTGVTGGDRGSKGDVTGGDRGTQEVTDAPKGHKGKIR